MPQLAAKLHISARVQQVHYEWYRNSTLIEEDPTLFGEDRERFTIQKNVLTILDVQERDAAMYQCAAINLHGTRFSSAQLRVLCTFPPCSALTKRAPGSDLAHLSNAAGLRCVTEFACFTTYILTEPSAFFPCEVSANLNDVLAESCPLLRCASRVP